ncbi:MAG: cysteine synthase A [Bacteroidaceae bacterium]|nr:cysteine synthase A [Bacteroidaceae bacterium]MBQ4039028.1 cysteine synthase A [Bacteroidaceae bacterium]
MKNRIADTIIDLIGNTPLLRVNNFSRAEGLSTAPLAKLEYFNPAGSVKDRAALYMILDAEERGLLKPGATIIEPTSGNTGVGLAFICTTRGYKLILTMPDTMSRERMSLLKAYGAQLILTPGKEGMAGSIAKAQELCDTIEGAVILQQFENGANPAAHYNTTAEEIWRDTEGNIDAFVACVGTGGTISGTARRLKELNPSIKVIGVEPAASPVLNGGEKGTHKIQGIGAGFIPSIYDASVVDEVFCVTDEEAMSATRMLAATEGVLTGFSSGAALHAAAELIRRGGYDGKNVVALLPDGGERYLSTELYA